MSNCRFCQAPLTETFVNLGSSPLANSLIKPEQINSMEPFFPLRVYVCEKCFLVQLEEFEPPENIFSDYVYFSSFSESWLAHCKNYVEKMIPTADLNGGSTVVEIASNDGYLLQFFKERNIPVLGIEPARNVADAAIKKGIPTETAFFNEKYAQGMKNRGISADLTVANNVLAHVPDINGFVKGFSVLLKKDGIATFEFPHLLRLIEDAQFDTIYHEHFSYLSLIAVKQIFETNGLRIFNVEELPTHGGSLRIYAQPQTGRRIEGPSVRHILDKEERFGLLDVATYSDFGGRVTDLKRRLLSLLIRLKDEGKSIVAYGAAAKGNTLLNYCGIRSDFLDYAADKNPNKQNKYLPGSRLQVYPPEKIFETKPDYVLILPWNLSDEIRSQMSEITEWGGKFIIPAPTPRVCE